MRTRFFYHKIIKNIFCGSLNYAYICTVLIFNFLDMEKNLLEINSIKSDLLGELVQEVKANQGKNYYVTSSDIREIDVIHEDFFEAADAAIKQLVNLEKIDVNKLNISLTKSYVELPNSKPIYKLVQFVGTNFSDLMEANKKLPDNKQSPELIRYNGHLYFAKFIQSVIVNVED